MQCLLWLYVYVVPTLAVYVGVAPTLAVYICGVPTLAVYICGVPARAVYIHVVPTLAVYMYVAPRSELTIRRIRGAWLCSMEGGGFLALSKSNRAHPVLLQSQCPCAKLSPFAVKFENMVSPICPPGDNPGANKFLYSAPIQMLPP